MELPNKVTCKRLNSDLRVEANAGRKYNTLLLIIWLFVYAAFEKQSVLFALNVSDIVLIKMWYHDIGCEQAANKPILKTVIQLAWVEFLVVWLSLLFAEAFGKLRTGYQRRHQKPEARKETLLG
ncbi:hypothetical protein RchiOBHm_Chr2g0143211 [Rosa chinensis]|uniref:Uncharacterized protein n=1 Tax=Rosa chinensis TaxID=74649 RepID=A0A2P6RY29_ROSCH|nr:hypothetical protein RchiOBHm_Chr2g0143211 [Rosa chinensis]